MYVLGYGVTPDLENAAEAWARERVHKSFSHQELIFHLLALKVPPENVVRWVAHHLLQKWRKSGVISRAYGKRWLANIRERNGQS